MTLYREKIDAYIDSKKDEMLADLAGLIAINSERSEAKEGMPYGEGPARVLDASVALMEKYGLIVKDYEHKVVTGDFGNGTDRELDILAHMDVVPVCEADWKMTRPFEMKIIDGKIYGRGTCDDKGPAVAALYAIRAVKELGIPLSKGVRLVLGSDEECGSSDLPAYFSKVEEAPCTFTPDADFPLINIEKGRLAKSFEASLEAAELPGVVSIDCGTRVNIVPAQAKARIQGFDKAQVVALADETKAATGVEFTINEDETGLEITAVGLASHASLPENGNNALTALLAMLSRLPMAACKTAEIIRGLAAMYPHGIVDGSAQGVGLEDKESGKLTMNLAILRMDADRIYGEFDVRSPICATEENLTEVLRARFAQIGLTMEGGPMHLPHYVPEESDFVQALLASYRAYTGDMTRPYAIGGGTYVHELKRGVAFGCGKEGVDTHMHGDDEYMELDMLIMSAKIFADAIVRICG